MHTILRNITCLFISLFALSSVPVAFAANSSSTTMNAKAVLTPTKDPTVSGVIQFIKVPSGVKIVADVSGLTPGAHGFHVHEWGDCSAPDGMSAGGHFNPLHMPHGAPNSLQRHAGDLGNLMADASGKAHYVFVDNNLSLTGPTSIVGRSIIVHEKNDDLHSQPAGNSGARIACGIIGVVQ